MFLKRSYVVSLAVFFFSILAHAKEAEPDKKTWTLESSIQQAAKSSPYIGVADAEIKSAEGNASQSGAWPNPVIEATSDNRLGIDDGTGGNEITQMSIAQTIPLGRLSKEQTAANAQLQAARQDRFYQQLQLENIVAKAFHKLQITEAKVKLAREQLEFADRYQHGRKSVDPLVRYLSPLEKKRLSIVRELANQEVISAEGEYGEAQLEFKKTMQLPFENIYKADALKPYGKESKLNEMQDKLANHSGIAALKFRQEAAEALVDLEVRKRIPDLTITYFRELDYLDNKRQNFNGISLGIALPLWDFNSGNIAKARAESLKTTYQEKALEQELSAKIQATHSHLQRLVAQAESYRLKVLDPAEEVLKLTNYNFKTGGVNVLSLIDANNTYFEARERYLELLYESWIEGAELRLAAGISLLNTSTTGGDL